MKNSLAIRDLAELAKMNDRWLANLPADMRRIAEKLDKAEEERSRWRWRARLFEAMLAQLLEPTLYVYLSPSGDTLRGAWEANGKSIALRAVQVRVARRVAESKACTKLASLTEKERRAWDGNWRDAGSRKTAGVRDVLTDWIKSQRGPNGGVYFNPVPRIVIVARP